MPELAGPTVDPIDQIPIIVGVTGKRQFSTDKAENVRLFAEFEARFRALVDYLDAELPCTPKVLLCGGAAGVDLLTARVVLEGGDAPRHPAWSVAIVLAFEREVFLQDFRDDPAALALFEAVEKHPRTIVKTLRPLYVKPPPPEEFSDSGAKRVAVSALAKEAADHTARGEHFEQFGLWLARSSTVLVAGMSSGEIGAMGTDATGDTKARLGGTARVVAFRRTGTPDAAADGVILRSSELSNESPIEEPDGQYVLLIDPNAQDAARNVPPVRTLRPAQRSFDMRAAECRFDVPRRTIYNSPGTDPFGTTPLDTEGERLRAALTLSRQFDTFHARQRDRSSTFAWIGWLRQPTRGAPDGFSTTTAPLASPQAPQEYLAKVRIGALNTQQTKAHDAYRHTLLLMIGVFLSALLIYEVYIELLHDLHSLLFTYLLLLVAGAMMAILVRRRRIQSIDEDYRGVKEMLRVQIAWWQAGITRPSVDRVHLRTIDSDMRLVREAMATLSLWALLRCDQLKVPAITRMTQWLQPDQVRSWLSSQATYFFKASRRQKLYKQLADRSFEIALVASTMSLAGLVLILWPTTVGTKESVSLPSGWIPLTLLVLLCALAEACAWTSSDESHVGDSVRFLREGMEKIKDQKGADLRSTILMSCFGVMLVGVTLILLSSLVTTSGTIDGARIAALALLIAICASCLVLIEPLVDCVADKLASSRHVERLSSLQTFILAVIVAGVVLSFSALECGLVSPLLPEGEKGDVPGFRALVLIFSVLLLAAAGMARFYTEKRNHAAQAAHYDDMHRAFRRAQGHLDRHRDLTVPEARRIIVEIGKLALDEAEAWMKAHRERPAEPIAGG